jgi:hypothetical protein
LSYPVIGLLPIFKIVNVIIQCKAGLSTMSVTFPVQETLIKLEKRPVSFGVIYLGKEAWHDPHLCPIL